MAVSISNEVKIVEALSVGDLSVNAEPRSEKDIMGNSLKKTIESLNFTIKSILKTSKEVMHGSEQVSDASQNISKNAENQIDLVHKLLSAVENISDDINNNAVSVEKSTKFVEKTSNEINSSTQKMENLLFVMEQISSLSNDIAKINTIIEDIAAQTNILAINASIEAARAGAAGRSFSVVAGEVKELAEKTANESKKILSIVDGSINLIAEGLSVAKETSNSITCVSENSIKLKELVKSIETASNKQAHAISQVHESIEMFSVIIQSNSSVAQESAAISEES